MNKFNSLVLIGFGVLVFGVVFIPQDDIIPIGDGHFGLLTPIGMGIMVFAFLWNRYEIKKLKREMK